MNFHSDRFRHFGDGSSYKVDSVISSTDPNLGMYEIFPTWHYERWRLGGVSRCCIIGSSRLGGFLS